MEMSFRLPSLSLPLRLALFALAELAGMLIQVFVGFIPGTLLMAAGLVLVAAKPFSNKPKDLGLEDWKLVTPGEVERIRKNLKASRRADIPLPYKKGLGAALTLVLLVAVMIAAMLEGGRAAIAFVDLLILLWPVFFFGSISAWYPQDLGMKMGSLSAALSEPLPESVTASHYLRFDKDKEGRMIPEDARFMLEPKRKPSDFVGVQFQAAINTGPNGKVPYLYAVFLTKGKGGTWSRLSRIRAEGYVVDPGGDDKYGTVVLRQETSGGGYHTRESDCKDLVGLCVKILSDLGETA